ncbi:hypothetical protein EYV94_06695 [Puteibacter caeruleilacunae]|nr:hypothetical protein EYV94_06695 [Puteibacter caeruleilacunae]
MNQILYKYLAVSIVSTLVFVACSEDQDRMHHQVNTLEVAEVNQQGALVKGDICFAEDLHIDDYGFMYRRTSFAPNEYAWMGGGVWQKLSLGSGNGNLNFEGFVSINIMNGFDYDVMAFAESESYTVNGNILKFVAQGGAVPSVDRVEPNVANRNDIVSIYGKNFSTRTAFNVVKFNEIQATVIGAVDTMLKVIVPGKLNRVESNIRIKVGDYVTKKLISFTVAPPVVEGIDKPIAESGDWITITGKSFEPVNGVKVGDVNCRDYGIIHQGAIKFKIPSGLPLGNVAIKLRYFDTWVTFEGFLEIVEL